MLPDDSFVSHVIYIMDWIFSKGGYVIGIAGTSGLVLVIKGLLSDLYNSDHRY